jgi:hypothetical protein
VAVVEEGLAVVVAAAAVEEDVVFGLEEVLG